MRRLFRILLNALMIGSLLLCLASAVLWVRSYWREDVLFWLRPVRPDEERPFFQLQSSGGGVAVSLGIYSPKWARELGAGGWNWYSFDPDPSPYNFGQPTKYLGFGYESVRDSNYRYVSVASRAWLGATVFAALPATRLVLAIRRRQRKREGHCAKCGYDLRATPQRCPECGAVPADAPRAGVA